MYRPENWNEQLRILLEKMPQTNSTEGKVFGMNCFEASADAILQALQDSGEYVDGSKAPYGYCYNHIGTYSRTFKGWFVLIPDAEDRDSAKV